MRHEDLRVLEVLSKVPSWPSDETVSIVNRVDAGIQMCLDIVELEIQSSNVTTSKQVYEETRTDGCCVVGLPIPTCSSE
ncbi:hypothetical protein V6N13_033966 [Hibiscus sabdariffa]